MQILEMKNRISEAKIHWMSLTTCQMPWKKMFSAMNQGSRIYQN